MKRNLLTFAAALLVLGSCTKTSTTSYEVPLGGSRYIFFDNEVATKSANLVTDMKGRTFGVIGFQYSSDWNTYKATGKPSEWVDDGNVAFYKTAVACDASGVCTYSPLHEWQPKKYYTFFAYWPMDGGVSVVGDSSTAGTPSITYTIPSYTDPTQLKDVITAMTSDVTNNGDGTVGFTFKHRLAAVVVEARNFNDANETITDLKLTLNSAIYTKATISLDPSVETVASGSYTGASYQIVPSGTVVTVTPSSTTAGASSITTVDVSGERALILIPKDCDPETGYSINGTISFTDKDGANKTASFTTTKDFEAGKKYSMIISFIDNAISIAIIKSGEWTDKDQNITFE